ncbi:MAG: hypothetical protein KatS3mg105_4814 [Gemmatales bacterium]|nr:MAG: hypothetical protein KatS3mg105_4814 [Gemmatales bacterium]
MTETFDDIDSAWHEAMQALAEADFHLTDAPLFLVLGSCTQGEKVLFEAAQLSFVVKQTPADADAPIHVYAGSEGIYVTCPDASLLSRQAALFASTRQEESTQEQHTIGVDSSEEDMFKTLQPKGQMKEVQSILARAREQGRSPDQLTEEEKNQILTLVAGSVVPTASPISTPSHASLLRDQQEVARLGRRLARVCELIVAGRQPYCPLNGILLIVPFQATSRGDLADETGELCARDLDVCLAQTGVWCPRLMLLADMEQATGFCEFIERFPKEQRVRRLGQRFPLAPDLPAEGWPEMIQGGCHWICQALFPNWVCKLLKLEPTGKETLDDVVRGNAKLFELLSVMRQREKPLARIIVRGVLRHNDAPPMFAGCYVAATGSNHDKEQAFLPGVFRRLIEEQNYVCWTDEILAREAKYRFWAKVGYTIIALAVLAVVSLSGYVLYCL